MTAVLSISCLLVLLSFSVCSHAAPLSDAYILYNIPLTETLPSYSFQLVSYFNRQATSIRFAIDSINADPLLLPNTTLHLISLDSKASVVESLSGISKLYDLYGNSIVLSFMGAHVDLTGPSASLTGAYDIPTTISFEQSIEYSDRKFYPTCFRLVGFFFFFFIACYLWVSLLCERHFFCLHHEG